MLIGYARVSTEGQGLDLQMDALWECGCEKNYSDVASGSKVGRPGLAGAMADLRRGDVLVVWRLDRLGRSLSHLIEVVSELQDRGVGFRSLQEEVNTESVSGKLVFHLFAALAEFERSIIRERTQAGLEAARVRGRQGGRPRKLTAKQVKQATVLLADGSAGVGEVCRTFGVHRSTLYRHVRRE